MTATENRDRIIDLQDQLLERYMAYDEAVEDGDELRAEEIKEEIGQLHSEHAAAKSAMLV